MLLEVFGVVFTLLVAYIIYTLFSSKSADNSSSIESFIVHSDDSHDDFERQLLKKKQLAFYAPKYDKPGKLVLILYGSEYGFTENIAKELFTRIAKLEQNEEGDQWQPRILNMKYFHRINWSQETLVFVAISTAGDGVPPTESRPFVSMLDRTSLDLSHVSYSVLAVGDNNYPHFCRAGRQVDERMRVLGARPIIARHDVDQEDRSVILAWFDSIMQSLAHVTVPVSDDYLDTSDAAEVGHGTNRSNPFMATLKVKRNLTSVSTSADHKETIHCEFDISGSDITWTAGDALGIFPENSKAEVELLLMAMNCSGSETCHINGSSWGPLPDQIGLSDALRCHFDLKSVKPELLQLLRKAVVNDIEREQLTALLAGGVARSNTMLYDYTGQRQVWDILAEFPDTAQRLQIQDVLSVLRTLQPRYYSISSSPLINKSVVCVTAAVVRYETVSQQREGVTTTYLQDRCRVGDKCPVFISQNPDFRLPSNGNVPLIMIGPGTGLAPFRAFIQERLLQKAEGQMVLYFGCRRRSEDYLYADELERWAADGHLTLQVAFSRESDRKVYVQHLLADDAAMLWSLLTRGAHVYVCGDARHMAHDVHAALRRIIVQCGNLADENEAEQYLRGLEDTHRYQKDVWVT